MRIQAIAAAMMLACITAAEGHSWYPHNCCHNNDCKPVPCNELIEIRHGLMWRGVVVFNETQVKPSQDQFCHVCVKEQVDVVPYVPLCVFVPPTSQQRPDKRARLWRDQGKPQQAREPLAPVHGWFTVGFDTLNLKGAKALSEEVGT